MPKWQKVYHLLITTIRHMLQGILPFCCCPEFSVYTHTYHKPPIVNKAHQMMRPLPSAQIAYEATASELPTATNDMIHTRTHAHTHTHTHTRLTALCPGLPGWAGTKKAKPIWILLKQETVSGSGISWAICKSAPRSRQITMAAPHHSVFYRPDALPAAQPTASKHWRHKRHKQIIWCTREFLLQS